MHGSIAAFLAASMLALVSANPVAAGQSNPASEIRRQVTGSFRFVDVSTHPIVVWFCRPPRMAADTRIVFVMHGSEPETARQACSLASPYIEPLNAVVLAPQFAEEYYPGDAYMFGDMIAASGHVRPKPEWALTAIERLFDIVRGELKLNRTNYDIVGFSGGAQFVHRLVLFVPEARFRRAVAASAGRYAFPSWSATFPYGLKDSPINQTGLRQAFSRDLVVLLGDRDISDRERESGAMAQGTTRFARGLRFFATATDEAAALGVRLHWELRIVSGVDHSAASMVRAALELLRQ